MNHAQASPAENVNQDLLNCDANIAYIEYVWSLRYNGTDNANANTNGNPIRAEYQKLFTCMSRCHKIKKKLGREMKFILDLTACRERSIPDMRELIENVSRRIPLTHPIPYMWNHDEQREIIGNLNMKWEEMDLQHYFTSFQDDDEDSDNEMEFDEKYGIARTELSDMAMRSTEVEFIRQCLIKNSNKTAKDEVVVMDREDRGLHRQVEEECNELLDSWKPPRDTYIPIAPVCVRNSSTPASMKM